MDLPAVNQVSLAFVFWVRWWQGRSPGIHPGMGRRGAGAW